MRVRRLGHGPIVSPQLASSIGTNIQGPSLVAAPIWLPESLGTYYLYFADHKGSHIRLASSDALDGPWSVYDPGALHLSDSCFLTEPPPSTDPQIDELHRFYLDQFGPGYDRGRVVEDALTPHIASPDVHVDDENQRIVMYFHGLESFGRQVTRVAISSDGINFQARPEVLGRSYFRVFEYDGWFYALVMPGQVLRSRDGLGSFEPGPVLFEPSMRHSAVLVRDGELWVFWSRVGDTPESILLSRVDLDGDWMQWQDSRTERVLAPEFAWEGSELPNVASMRGAVHQPANQLRDPAVFVDGDQVFLLYSAAGESCIGIAEISLG